MTTETIETTEIHTDVTPAIETVSADELATAQGGFGIKLKPVNWGEVGHAALGGAVQGAEKGYASSASKGLKGAAIGTAKGAAIGGLTAAGKDLLHQEFGI